MVDRYIIEPVGERWKASVENRDDLPTAEGEAPLYALRALNWKLYGLQYERRQARELARKTAYRHLRDIWREPEGIPHWWPRWAMSPKHRQMSVDFKALVLAVAKELDERGGGTWVEVVQLVKERWTTCTIPAPE